MFPLKKKDESLMEEGGFNSLGLKKHPELLESPFLNSKEEMMPSFSLNILGAMRTVLVSSYRMLRKTSTTKGRNFLVFDKMKELMEMKKQADRIKKELDASTVEVNEVSGVKIVVSGSQDFRSLEIDEALVSAGDKRKLEADLLRSVNAAIKQSQNLAAQKMKAVMPGF